MSQEKGRGAAPPPPRVALVLSPEGHVINLVSDEPITALFICDHVPRDRVYHFRSVEVGREKVDEIVGSSPIGFDGDGSQGDEVAEKLRRLLRSFSAEIRREELRVVDGGKAG